MKITRLDTKDFEEKLSKLLLRRQKLLDRLGEEAATFIANYRQHGEKLLLDYAREFDGIELESTQLWVDSDQIKNAHKLVSPAVRQAVDHTIKRVERFQSEMRRTGFQTQLESGLYWGIEIRPLDRVGIYCPKSYFLTLILCSVPARIAGVKDILLATPPEKKWGPPYVDPAVLYAAKLFDIDRILISGGAGALAAMAFGTEKSLPVQKIVGPTGKLGTVVKQKLSGYVGVDSFAGPTEVAFVCDKSTSMKAVLADIVGLADHNPEAEVFLFHEDAAWIQSFLEEVLVTLPKIKNNESRNAVRNCLENNTHFFVAPNIEASIEVANQLSPGILVLSLVDASRYTDRVRSCGCLLLGGFTPPVSLDLIGGGTGIVPTLGAAAFSSMSSPAAYQRAFSVIEVEKSALERLEKESLALAQTEGFSTHEGVFQSRLE